MTDEELQERIEQGDHSNSKDAKAYRLVFAALRREPDFRLRTNFADRVARRALHVEAQSSHEIIWLLLGLFSFVVALGIATYLTGFKPSLGAFEFVSSYPGLFVFGVLFVGLLQWVDKRIIRKTTPTRV